jgi:hypothetical protein
MATLIVIEDHARVGRALLSKENFLCEGDALARVRELLREEESRRRGKLAKLLTLWIECNDGTVMDNAAVRREAAQIHRPRSLARLERD